MCSVFLCIKTSLIFNSIVFVDVIIRRSLDKNIILNRDCSDTTARTKQYLPLVTPKLYLTTICNISMPKGMSALLVGPKVQIPFIY